MYQQNIEQHWSYDLLKHMAINDKHLLGHLEDLKSMFQNEIGSVRNMSRIKNVDDLLDCLQRHDYLSETNIEPLRQMADQLARHSLEEAVSTYICPKSSTGYSNPYNEYRELRLAEELKNNLCLSGKNNSNHLDHSVGNTMTQQPRTKSPIQPTPAATPYAYTLTDKKRAAIYKYVAENIGRFWRALGRELELKQGKLDELEMEYPRDLVSRVHKMLQIFEEDECNDPKRFVLTLCRALDESRRKDMRRKVEEIMSH